MDGFLLLFGLDLDLDLDLDLSIASVANLWSGFLASVEFGCESMDLTGVPVEGGRKSLDRDVLVVAASIFPMETDWGSKCGNPSTTGGSNIGGGSGGGRGGRRRARFSVAGTLGNIPLEARTP